MSMTDPVLEFHLTRRHRVVLLVATVDRRIVPALRFLTRIRAADAYALHIAADAEVATQLAIDWMELDLTWLPLHIVEPASPRVDTAVREAIREQVRPGVPVTAIIPLVEVHKWWHPLLHRRASLRITAALQSLPDVTTVMIPSALPACANVHAAMTMS